MVFWWVRGFCQGDQKLKKVREFKGRGWFLRFVGGVFVIVSRGCTLIIRVEVDDLQLRKSIVIVYD